MTTRKHSCGAPLVTTFDALSRPRERCPACDRVAPPSRLPAHLQGISQAKWAPPRPTAVPRRRIFTDPVVTEVGRPKLARPAPLPPTPAPVIPRKAVVKRRGWTGTPAFKPKQCRRCSTTFTPHSGRQITCDDCRKLAA